VNVVNFSKKYKIEYSDGSEGIESGKSVEEAFWFRQVQRRSKKHNRKRYAGKDTFVIMPTEVVNLYVTSCRIVATRYGIDHIPFDCFDEKSSRFYQRV
jgi:hypothetical protein